MFWSKKTLVIQPPATTHVSEYLHTTYRARISVEEFLTQVGCHIEIRELSDGGFVATYEPSIYRQFGMGVEMPVVGSGRSEATALKDLVRETNRADRFGANGATCGKFVLDTSNVIVELNE